MLIEPLNCTYGAFLKARPRPGESVLIFGSGPAGLLFLELARAVSAARRSCWWAAAQPSLDLGRQRGAVKVWEYQDEQIAERGSRTPPAEKAPTSRSKRREPTLP